MKYYEITKNDCDIIKDNIEKLKSLRGVSFKKNIWGLYFMAISEIDINEINNNNKESIIYQVDNITKIIIRLLMLVDNIKPFKIKITDMKNIYTLLDNSIRCFINNREYLNTAYFLMLVLVNLGYNPINCILEKIKSQLSKKGYINDRNFFIAEKGTYDRFTLIVALDNRYILYDNIDELENEFMVTFKGKEVGRYIKWYKANYEICKL